MNNITYTKVVEYNIPNLVLPPQPKVELGKYARMRKEFLLQHHKVVYYNYLTSATLIEHLAEVQERAYDMEEMLTRQMAKQEDITEELKSQDLMTWVKRMNNLKNRVEEIVKQEVIYEL